MPKFERGNRAAVGHGRPRGVLSTTSRAMAEACREIWAEEAPGALRRIIRGRNPLAAVRALQLVADRGFGKSPETVRIGIDPQSPEGVLLKMAGQVLPGAESDDWEDDDDTPALLPPA